MLRQPDLTLVPVLPPHPYTFPLDPFQQHALAAIAADENVLVCAKTGSGKTLVGEYQCWHSLQKGKRVFYTTPIKSLSNQKFYDLKHLYPQARVGIMTGDIKFCPDADIVIMTTEILRNLLYKRGTATERLGLTASLSLDGVDAIIFDECHYINDRDRGCIWEETMILLPPAIRMVMLSATLDHPEYLATWLGNLKAVPIHLIQTQYRVVPLTHSVILPPSATAEEGKWLTVMDAHEHYHAPAYTEWYRKTLGVAAEERAFQRRVIATKGEGAKGGVEGKARSHTFPHRLNETIAMLQARELLPALFFVLSRANCETYAAAVEHPLLDTSDAAAVDHIIGFHLHRYHLDAIPQYHQIRALLLKGVAFHHSGLLPVLKEIVEILFTKGYVRVLFCTETFAVGLNMPTKTVVFTGFKKYDDTTDSMRLLRTDEYMQMAGRAGRRGKDTRGVVIYVPDRDPVTPEEMERMMRGARPPVESRMQFGYEFLLKTLQAGAPNQPTLRWLQVMQDSYWFQQQEKERIAIRQKRESLLAQRVTLEEPYATECKKRVDLEEAMRGTVNAERKALQRQLDTVKNRQLGPRWTKALEAYHAQRVIEQQLEALEYQEAALSTTGLEQITAVAQFLHRMGYIEHANPLELTAEHLGLKGILATEVNEAHPILLTELYQEGALHPLTGNELVSVLACFLESKGDRQASATGSSAVLQVLSRLEAIAAECEAVERGVGLSRDWSIHTQMVEPMRRWMEGESVATLCAEHELFEGNFHRMIMKVANMLDECLALATYCQHTDQVEKIQEVRGRIVQETMTDSLYLRL